MSSRSNTVMRRRCRIIGTTRSLQIMIDSATEATITIAVAAESPPRKAIMLMV